MSILDMSFKMIFSRSFIITMITRILDTFMFRFNMLLQIAICGGFKVTLVARIFNTLNDASEKSTV